MHRTHFFVVHCVTWCVNNDIKSLSPFIIMHVDISILERLPVLSTAVLVELIADNGASCTWYSFEPLHLAITNEGHKHAEGKSMLAIWMQNIFNQKKCHQNLAQRHSRRPPVPLTTNNGNLVPSRKKKTKLDFASKIMIAK